MNLWLKKIWEWVRTDGLLHIETSAMIVIFLMVVFHWFVPLVQNCVIAVVIALFAGVGKEIYDYVSGKGCAEYHDLYCDLIGIVFGLTMMLCVMA